MPSPQKYGLRVALRPSNALEAVTHMDEKAVREEIELAKKDGRDAHFNCVNAMNEEPIQVYCNSADIQMWMHHKWERPVPQSQPLPPGLDERHLRRM